MKIRQIEDREQKSKITLQVMGALPEWFSPPEDILRKAEIHRDYPFFAAEKDGDTVGFAAIKVHNPFTADLYTIGVLKESQHQGAGSLLLSACEEWCRKQGFVYLTVKTLDGSAYYPPYDATRAFYRRAGFIPLEVFPTFWGEENPCLFLVKAL